MSVPHQIASAAVSKLMRQFGWISADVFSRARVATLISKGHGLVSAGWSRQSSWGLLDQIVISVSNFAMTLVVARALGPEAFGVYSIIFMSLMLITSVQAAVICQPHNVRGATLEDDAYRDLTASTAIAQVIFTASTGIVTAAGATVVVALGWASLDLVLACLLAMVAIQWHEFFRRVLYTENRLRTASALDTLGYGGQAFVVAVLWLSGSLLSVSTCLFAMGSISAVAGTAGFLMVRGSLQGRIRRDVMSENWRFGKWLGGAVGLNWLTTQTYLYLAAYFLGPAAVGTIRAADVVMRPAAIFFSFLDTTLPIKLRNVVREGPPAVLNTLVKRLSVLLTVPMVALCVALAFFGPLTMELLFGKGYAVHEFAPAMLAVYYCIFGLSRITASALRAREQTHSVFIATVGSALATGLLGWALVRFAGVYGVLFGMVLAAAVSYAIQWWLYRSRPEHLPMTGYGPHSPL
jgi:O-antigen/teichoic acid export membrane protein